MVSVYSEKNEATSSTVQLPAVFRAPVRPDIVQFVHTNVRKNSRQPYAVSKGAGKCNLTTPTVKLCMCQLAAVVLVIEVVYVSMLHTL